MSKNRFSKVILFAMTSFLLISSLLFFVANHQGLGARLVSWPALAASKIGHIFLAPGEWLESLSDDINSLIATYEENKQLKQRLFSLENQDRLIKELEADNAKLRQELALDTAFTSSQLIGTRVISRSTLAWLDFVTVDKGLEDQVTDNMFLVSEAGLVGLVSQVMDESSQVTLLTNSAVHKPLALKLSSGDNWVYGILIGYDSERKAIKVSQFNRQEGLEVGATVLTSGLDGGSLADVPVGQVVSLERDNDQALVAYVRLVADSSDLEQVHLIGRASHAD